MAIANKRILSESATGLPPWPETTMGLTETLGSRVKALRRSKGWTQAHFAEMARMSTSEVSRIENGHREPQHATLERLAHALGVEAQVFFLTDQTPTSSSIPRRAELPTDLLRGVPPHMLKAVIRAAVILSRAAEDHLKRSVPRRSGSRRK